MEFKKGSYYYDKDKDVLVYSSGYITTPAWTGNQLVVLESNGEIFVNHEVDYLNVCKISAEEAAKIKSRFADIAADSIRKKIMAFGMGVAA